MALPYCHCRRWRKARHHETNCALQLMLYLKKKHLSSEMHIEVSRFFSSYSCTGGGHKSKRVNFIFCDMTPGQRYCLYVTRSNPSPKTFSTVITEKRTRVRHLQYHEKNKWERGLTSHSKPRIIKKEKGPT